MSNVQNIELCGIDEYNVDEVLDIAKSDCRLMFKMTTTFSVIGLIMCLIFAVIAIDGGYNGVL